MLRFWECELKKDAIDLLVVPVCENAEIHARGTIKSLAEHACKVEEFTGKTDEEVIFYKSHLTKAKRVMFLGIGKKESLDIDVFRRFAGKAVKKAISKNIPTVVIAPPSAKKTEIIEETLYRALFEGAFLGNHIFDLYKEEKKHSPLSTISLYVQTKAADTLKSLPEEVESVCSGTIMARNWVSIPSNDKPPEAFANMILEEGKKAGLEARVFDEKELEAMGCGGILGVGMGSENRPKMVVLEYKPKRADKVVALVGKGVTFDSGGINLKPGTSSGNMKIDMSGAAAVAATLITCARMKPDIHVVGILPLVENMPSGSSYRPGDILKSYSGKTVEVGNTDAEGRLILMDGLAYAEKTYSPDYIVDMATLTGACMIALGEKIAGVFSKDEDLAERISRSAKRTHERCWKMPMPEDYLEKMKSKIADISNISESRWGGAITASLFLSEFVKTTPYAHIDIAGPAFIAKANAYCPPGGTGFGVRLLWDFIDNL